MLPKYTTEDMVDKLTETAKSYREFVNSSDENNKQKQNAYQSSLNTLKKMCAAYDRGNIPQAKDDLRTRSRILALARDEELLEETVKYLSRHIDEIDPAVRIIL